MDDKRLWSLVFLRSLHVRVNWQLCSVFDQSEAIRFFQSLHRATLRASAHLNCYRLPGPILRRCTQPGKRPLAWTRIPHFGHLVQQKS